MFEDDLGVSHAELYIKKVVPTHWTIGHKSSIHKTFRGYPGRLLNVLCRFNVLCSGLLLALESVAKDFTCLPKIYSTYLNELHQRIYFSNQFIPRSS